MMWAELRRSLARLDAWIGHLPVRVRLTLSFAAVMVVLFGAIALALYFTFAAGLNASIDNSLRLRSHELAGINKNLGADAQIINTATWHRTKPLSLAEIHTALSGSGYVSVVNSKRWLLVRRPGKPHSVLAVGESLSQR